MDVYRDVVIGDEPWAALEAALALMGSAGVAGMPGAPKQPRRVGGGSVIGGRTVLASQASMNTSRTTAGSGSDRGAYA